MKYWILISSLVHITGFAQTYPHEIAHAHNDYAQNKPLFDALENGFTGIEADVHLVHGALLVAHNHPSDNAKTLDALYLKPLDSIARQNGGLIYANHNIPVVLMIDIKTDAEDTYKALAGLLSAYEKSLNTPTHKGAIQIVISGNRPIDLIRTDPRHLSALDGRPEDIGKGLTSAEMPWISENYNKIIKWNGTGSPSASEYRKLQELALRVHAENKKLRLWAIPDNVNAWRVLLDAGIDIINTDKLRELNIFLSNRKL